MGVIGGSSGFCRLDGVMWAIGGLADQVQEARWEELGGCKVMTNVCNLGGIEMLAWVDI